MNDSNNPPKVTMIGGGMITRVQLLPTVYQLQRDGLVGEIDICALNAGPLAELEGDRQLRQAFPHQDFTPHPDPAKVDELDAFPDLYREVLNKAPGGSLAVIAVPDHLHYPVLQEAISRDLHVCVVKPLVLTHAHAEEIAKLARERGLVVGVDYHKRFDYRNMIARSEYRKGRFGEFRLAQANLHECWYYRDSNFQNWCTCQNSDMFTYIGCHYVDLVAFITGLRPVSVSVCGVVDKYPNGNEGFLWTDGRVIWDNGAILSVMNSLGYPDAAPGGNSQAMTMWGKGEGDATLIVHDDQFRGVRHTYLAASDSPGDTVSAEPNPDYYRLIDQGGEGLTPIGYGHRSVDYILRACCKAAAIEDLSERRKLIDRYDADGIMATPVNSSYNELVIEAGRKSILSGGREVTIDYRTGTVGFREY